MVRMVTLNSVQEYIRIEKVVLKNNSKKVRNIIANKIRAKKVFTTKQKFTWCKTFLNKVERAACRVKQTNIFKAYKKRKNLWLKNRLAMLKVTYFRNISKAF